MACGCPSTCTCTVQGINGVIVTGDGSIANPYQISPPPETLFAATSDDSIDITPGGTNGHAPNFAVRIDPASPATISVSPAGIAVACCASGTAPVDTIVVDTTIDASYQTVLVDSSAGPVEVTLPAVPSAGLRFDIKDYGPTGAGFTTTNAVTINPNGNNIDGDPSIRTLVSDGDAFTLISNGSDWGIF